MTVDKRESVGKRVTVHPNSINHSHGKILSLIAIYHCSALISSLSSREVANKQLMFSTWSKAIFLRDKQRSTEERNIFLNDNKTLFFSSLTPISE